MTLTISTQGRRQVVDITDDIQAQLAPGFTGAVAVTVLHTTAAITTADLDPGTDQDLLDALDKLLPGLPWRHPHNPAHAPDHLLASIIGPSVVVPAQGGKLLIGTWQRLILIELDGPRRRDVAVTCI